VPPYEGRLKHSLHEGGTVSSISDLSVSIQTSSQSVPSTPCWLGEVTLIAPFLKRLGVLTAMEKRVRFARRRFGRYEVIDFLAVLLGYAISGERTLQVFYERVEPFAPAFMALFGRNRLPARSTLSRFLAAVDQAPVEALRTLFLEDLVARPLEKEEKPGGLWDRQESHWLVFDVDGTREAARQRALPQTTDRPPAQRRLREVCAPGYLGRKRGEIVRTRTTVLQAHTHQWLGTFSGAGNGDYRGELLRAVKAISRVIVATHPASATAAAVGETREGMVYELFFTALPVGAFTAADVVDLYLGRGAFETALADEDQEQDVDRWCSHAPCGQEFWQILCQWVWNEAPAPGTCSASHSHAHHGVCPCRRLCRACLCHSLRSRSQL